MAYARYNTLRKVAENVGWGFVQTNSYGSNAKSHLLQMRKEGLVKYTPGTYATDLLNRYNVRPWGPDKNANWYTLTWEGLQKLMELWPGKEKWSGMAHYMIKIAFDTDDKLTQTEIAFRRPKK